MKNKLLLAILFIAFVLSFTGLMPNVVHSDESHVQVYSWDLARNAITEGDFHPRTFKYGTFIFYYQALFSLPVILPGYLLEIVNSALSSSFSSETISFAAYHESAVRTHYGLLTHVGRAAVALLGVVSVYLVYLIAKRLFNQKVGLMAAIFLAVSPLYIRDSHYITTDVPAALFFLIAFYFLILMIQEKRLRWYILSGFFLGVSSTIRYFPVALLVYPLAIIFSFENKKRKEWLRKTLLSLVFIPVGVFIGVPYLFLDPQAPALFSHELEKYILPWYQTSISSYVFSLGEFIISGGKTALPPLSSLAPRFFRPFYASYIFFNGFWPLPTIFALLGAGLLAFKSFKKFLLLSIIPLATFFYLSLWVPAAYERLIIPILPFLAILAGFFIFELSQKVKSPKKAIVALTVVGVVPGFLLSFSASYACGGKSTRQLQAEFIEKNIPEGAKTAYTIPVTFPSQKDFKLNDLEPDVSLSLEEARRLGAEYAFINLGRLDYIYFPDFFNNYFFVPAREYENSYYSLVLSEYQSRAELLGKVEKPYMCDANRTYFYKIPDTPKGELLNQVELSMDDFVLEDDRYLTRPMEVIGGKVYTFSAKARVKEDSLDLQGYRIFLRLDFYNLQDGTFFKKLTYNTKKIWLLLKHGMTPVYFEKKREILQVFDDYSLPGKVVALSPREQLAGNPWKISVTAKAPEGADYMILSFQTDREGSETFYLDDIVLFGPGD